MVDHLFIAEKPSLAREVAEARAKQLGVSLNRRSNTHYEVGSDTVTCVIGHFYDTAPPDHYDARYKNWSIPDLPIIPRKWQILPGKERVGAIREIQALIRQSRKIVNVGDAAREGQLLIDELLVESGVDPHGDRVLRLWLQELTEAKKIQALEAMFPNARKRDLYQAAVGRQRADWLLGMNMTRLYTCLARKSGMQNGVITVGRVQTPTLRLVVDRDLEIEKFKAVDHYLPTGQFRHANGVFKASWIIPAGWSEGLDAEDRLVDRAVAQRIADKIAGKAGAITRHETSPKSKAPPGGFDLTAIQKECSAKFGMSVNRTLEVVQSLYEKKVTSYPRSDCAFLPNSIHKDEAAQIIGNLKGVNKIGDLAGGANLRLKSPIWNDGKVTDHYAIIPTTEATAGKIAALDADERKVFDLIAKRFVAQFYPDHRWNATTVEVTVEGERFKANGKVVTDQGWKVVYGASPNPNQPAEGGEDEDDEEPSASGKSKEKEEVQKLPQMAKTDPVDVVTAGLAAKRTTPPARFTEGTLIDAMQNVHKFIKDTAAKKLLKETSGIGTAATRAKIIEGLFGRKFLETKGKGKGEHILSTKLGREVIDVLDDGLTEPALTANWEDRLKQVEGGELELDTFLGDLGEHMRSLVAQLENTTLKITNRGPRIEGHGESCPKCGKGVMLTRVLPSGPNKNKPFLSCDGYSKDDPNSCRYAKWPDDKGRQVKALPGEGATCEKCGVGKMMTRVVQSGDHKGKAFLSCDAYKKDDPNSCRHSVWPKAEVKSIAGHGETCALCKKGRMVTRVVTKDGPNKGKSLLVCDSFNRDDPTSCKNMVWPKETVQPLQGHGETCPSCRNGRLETKTVSKDGPNKGKRFLACSANVRGDDNSCRYMKWPDEPRAKVAPMKGHGETCPACKKGKMVTRVISKEGPKKGQTFLSCDQGKYGDNTTCQHVDWGDGKGSGGSGRAAGGSAGGLGGSLKRVGARS